jgi:hypothetical protein
MAGGPASVLRVYRRLHDEIVVKTNVEGEPDTKLIFAATVGSALDEPVAPGLITVGFGKDPAEMQVHTFDPSGKPAPRSFHIACFRD